MAWIRSGVMAWVIKLWGMQPPGFKFSPSDEDLISYYLKRKIEGLKDDGVIAEVDICGCEPWDLPGKSLIPSDHEWYFFSSSNRKYPTGSQAKRATKSGYWKATGKQKNIKAGSVVIGTKRTLVFYIGRAPKGDRTDWKIHEYCINGNQDPYVLCYLQKKLDLTKSDGPSQESASHEGSSHATAFDDHSQVGNDMPELLTGVHEEGQGGKTKSKEDDCFSDIMNDDIVNLGDIPLPGSPLPFIKGRSEKKGKGIQEVEPTRIIPQVHPVQGTANRRIKLQTSVSNVKDGNRLAGDNDSEGSVAQVIMEGNDDEYKKLVKRKNSGKNSSCIRNGWMILVVLIIILVVLQASLWLFEELCTPNVS